MGLLVAASNAIPATFISIIGSASLEHAMGDNELDTSEASLVLLF
jgi:hypothetical protein